MDFKNQISLWKNKGAAPSKELEEGGFSPGYKPPAGVFNWFWHIVSGGIQELQNKLSAEENSRINENYYPEYTSDAIDGNTKFYIDIANMGDGEGIYKRRTRRIDNSLWKDLVSGQELKLSGENYQEDGIVSGGASLSMPLDDYLCFNQSKNFTIAFSAKLSETSETNDLITIGGTRKIVIQQKGADGIRLITFDDTDTMHVYPSNGCIMPKSYNKYHHYIVSMNIDTNVVRWFQDGLMESASSSEITNNNNFIKADGERSIKLFSDSQDKTGVQYIKILDYSVSISQAKKLFEKHSTIDYTNDKTQYDIKFNQHDVKFNMLDRPIYEDAETRAQLTSGEQLSAALSKIKKWLTDLKDVAFTGSYNNLINKPIIPRPATIVIGTSTAGYTLNDVDYLCDGTADQEEINAAISALPKSGGKIVLLEGEYNISSNILLNRDNVKIEGMGEGTRINRGSYQGGSSAGMINISRSYCELSHFSLVNNSNYSGSCYGIYCRGASSASPLHDNKIHNLHINNEPRAIYVGYANEISICDNYITSDFTMLNRYDIYVAYGCKCILISNNTIIANGGIGITISGATNNLSDVQIINNFVIMSDGQAIVMSGTRPMSVIGNQLEGNSGVLQITASYCAIIGNAITSTSDSSAACTIWTWGPAQYNQIAYNILRGHTYKSEGDYASTNNYIGNSLLED